MKRIVLLSLSSLLYPLHAFPEEKLDFSTSGPPPKISAQKENQPVDPSKEVPPSEIELPQPYSSEEGQKKHEDFIFNNHCGKGPILKEGQSNDYKKIIGEDQSITWGCIDKKGNKIGIWSVFNKEGQLILQLNMKKNQREGAGLIWHTNGKPKILEFYHQDKVNGWMLEWDSNGSLKHSKYSENDTLNGDFILYHENGQVKHHTSFIHGKETGLLRLWDSNGKLIEYVELKDGKEQSPLYKYHSNGKQRAYVEYKDGVKHGLEVNWYESGNPKLQHQYIDGKNHGQQLSWYDNGNLKCEHFFQNGVQAQYTCWKEDGSVDSYMR